jgi:tripartite-type tricarboxylate transporter receptor subunit TctC
MQKSRRQFLTVSAALGAGLLAPSTARTQGNPLRMYVGFPPGGAIDVTARVLSERARDTLNVPVVVENRPGAAGNIAAAALKQARPDGASAMLAPVNVYCISKQLYKSLPFDPDRDFLPAGIMAAFPWGLAVASNVPASSVQELAAWLKANPRNANVGMAAPGSEGHLLSYAFSRAIGVDFNFVGYKGGAPMAQDLIAGQIPIAFDSVVNQIGPHTAGRFKVLAVSSSRRVPALPQIPTFEELGYKTVTGETWIGLSVPAGTPEARLRELNEAYAKAAATEEVKSRLSQVGLEARPTSPQQMAQAIRTDTQYWGALIRELGLKLD